MVYYDLEKSPFTYEINNIKFYFSSKFYLEKFKKSIDNYLMVENYRFTQRYKLKLEKVYFNGFLLVSLYKKCEKRGFYIESNMYKIFDNTFI